MTRKKIIIWVCVAIGGVVLAVIAAPFIGIIMWVTVAKHQINKVEAVLQKPEVYQTVAAQMALYCQSDTNFFPEYIGAAWLPAEVRKIGYPHGRIDPEDAYLEFGGGFHHFGYRLERNKEQSSSDTNIWKLIFLSEDSDDKPLITIQVPATNHLEEAVLLGKVIEGYDSLIATAGSGEDSQEGVHQNKIQTLLRFNRIPEAREVCRDLLKRVPNDWWAVLVNALITAQEKSRPAGDAVINEWVQKQPNFFSYLDLAYYYELQSEFARASDAIIKATEYDANTDWGHGGNSEYRGYTAAMCAFHAAQYPTVIKLCNKMLQVKVNGDYAKQGFRVLKAAAEQRLRNEQADPVWASDILPFDPFENVDIEKLLQRKLERPHRKEAYNYNHSY